MDLQNPTPVEPEATLEQTPEDVQSGVQKRIDVLVRQREDGKRANEDLATQLAALREQVDTQNKVLAARLDSSARPDTEFADLFGSSQTVRSTKGKQLPSEDLNQQIAQTVSAQIAPLLQEIKNEKAQKAISVEHQQAFNEFSQFFPELREAGSNLQMAFNDIWNSIPELHDLPKGPAMAGAMAAGVLQQESRAVQQDARKIAASGPAPSGNLSGRLEALPAEQANKNEKLIKDLQSQGESVEGLTQQDFSAMIGLKLGQANANE